MNSPVKKNQIWFSYIFFFTIFLYGCGRLAPITQPVENPFVPTITSPGSLFEAAEPTITPIPTTTVQLETTDNTVPEGKFQYTPSEGDWFLYTGEYIQAASYFKNIFNNVDSTRNEKAAALLGLGRVEYLENRFGTAIEYFDLLISEYPLTEPANRSNFFLGEIYYSLGNFDTAAIAYQNFIDAYPGILDDVIGKKLGDLLIANGEPLRAVEAYQVALDASQSEYEIDEINIKIAQAYQSIGENDLAIQIYLDTYNNTQSAYINAKINLLLGQLYQQLGQNESAYERYQYNVTYWPYYYDTYTSLVILVQAEQTVDEYQRGLTDYYAGLYGVAVDAFNRYIESTTMEERNGDVHFYNGLSYIQLEQYDNAINQWQILVDNFQSSNFWSNGTDEIAYTQWLYLNDNTTAAETYLKFVEDYPVHEDSPDFLYYAARMYERDNEFELAAQTWERMLREYPAYPDVFRAQQLAGVSYYRAANYEAARQSFETMLQYATTPDDQAAAQFWLGKTYLALGDNNLAISSWETAFRTTSTGYYGIRAEQLLNAEEPFMNDPYFNPVIDLDTEREQAEIWMRSTFGIGEGVDLSAEAALSNDPTAIRGELLWAIGFYDASLDEYEKLRENFIDDPINTFRLLERLVERGHYRAAAFASRHIIDKANLPPEDYLLAPRYFNHLRYTTQFEPIVSQTALTFSLSPQILFSQIRQESLYDSRIGSSAGAIGLMQIIPTTGEYINNQYLGDENYTTDDLFLPSKNILMGTYYIDLQRDYFGGQWIPALAAYNAGPGNSQAWLDMAGGDIDLFVEIIRFAETRDYILHIMETYHAYSILYSNAQ